MGQTIIQVDSFTNKPFSGNPAGVCILTEDRDEHWMQQIATEMNLAATGFLLAQDDGYSLRWFTPTTEIDLCGHATLASAHILWEMGYLPLDAQARFHTKSGLLSAQRQDDWVEMDFPAEPETETPSPPNLVEALGVTPNYVGKNRMDYLVEVDSEETVRALHPDLNLLQTIACRGVIVTARADATDYDFVSRFFAPNAGIDEDSVTGSAHCCLGPFWQRRLEKDTMVGYQASSRGGVVRVRVNGDRVVLGGQAVTILQGELV